METHWYHVKRNDLRAVRLADRHYSRQTPGARDICPPGRAIVLIVPTAERSAARALWVSSYQMVRDDGFDCLTNPYFRSETDILSSTLIREAIAITRHLWRDILPTDGFHTFVDPAKVKSSNPGYCFQCAGFDKHPQRTRDKHLIRYVLPAEKFMAVESLKPKQELVLPITFGNRMMQLAFDCTGVADG